MAMNDRRHRRRNRGNFGENLIVACVAGMFMALFGALATLGLIATLAQAWPEMVTNLWDSQMRFPTPSGVTAVLGAAGFAVLLLTDPMVQWLSRRKQ